MSKFSLLTVVIVVWTLPLNAQGPDNRLFAGFQYHQQKLWSHRPEIEPYTGKLVHSYEMILGFKASGEKAWHQLYNNPAYGLGFFYSNLGFPDVLGEVRSGFLFFEVPLGNHHLIKRRINMSLGLSRLSQFYDPITNPENRFIGTPWNVHFNFKYGLRLILANRIELLPGVSFTHYSNGAYKMPNRGLNLFDLNLGMRVYAAAQPRSETSAKGPYEVTGGDKQRFLLFYGTGLMQRDIGDPHYRAHTFSLAFDERTGPRCRWGVGLEVFYDEHARDLAVEQLMHPDFGDMIRAGGYVSHELIFNRMSLLFNLGAYVYYGQKPARPIYKRAALRYDLGHGLFAHFGIKAHEGRADHMEWGLGIAL